MFNRLVVIFGLLFVQSCSIASSQTVSVDSRIPFNWPKDDYGEVSLCRVEKEIAKDTGQAEMPFDAPAHTCYSMQDKRPLLAFEKGPRFFNPARSFICLVPTSDPSAQDFAAAYPNFSKAVELLRSLIKTKPKDFRQFDDLFDFPYNNAGWSFKAKVEYLTAEKVAGVFFLTQYSQELAPNLVNNEELTANFQGLTHDGKYYVAARLAPTHKTFPAGIDFTDHRVQEEAHEDYFKLKSDVKIRKYLEVERQKVERLDENSFRPSLPKLKGIITSISVD